MYMKRDISEFRFQILFRFDIRVVVPIKLEVSLLPPTYVVPSITAHVRSTKYYRPRT